MLSKYFVSLFTLVVAVMAAPAKRASCSNGRTASNPKCCVWYDVLDDIQQNLFEGGQCGSHESLRLTFHDAIAFSPNLTRHGQFGGGDGSIMAFAQIETATVANTGVDEIVELQRPFALKHNVSFGDFSLARRLEQLRGRPRLQFLAGRSNISQPAPDGLIPEPKDSVDSILLRMGDAGFNAAETVDLLISHTVAGQEHIDTVSIRVYRRGTPLDSTPSTFDAQFFVETLLNGTAFPGTGPHLGEVESPLAGELRLQSDFVLARDPRTACEWQSFVTNRDLMALKFQIVMAKLAVLGQNPFTLTDCSEVIPNPPPAPANIRVAQLPAGKTLQDIQGSCPSCPSRPSARLLARPRPLPASLFPRN
ncbi:Versatile peroxidase VPL2 [Grifola frondosa]|uniref:Peroxidase n=1 Tax=Grifola frondosa TaxID=5627 RepID=A0A1C7MJG4_GRIFR|nr:Versatile peroxidase VPL2 [Grifola frondosa]